MARKTLEQRYADWEKKSQVASQNIKDIENGVGFFGKFMRKIFG